MQDTARGLQLSEVDREAFKDYRARMKDPYYRFTEWNRLHPDECVTWTVYKQWIDARNDYDDEENEADAAAKEALRLSVRRHNDRIRKQICRDKARAKDPERSPAAVYRKKKYKSEWSARLRALMNKPK